VKQSMDSSILGPMTRILIFATSVLLLAATAQAQNLYKWVDQDGNVTYQDTPPPGEDSTATPFAEDAEVAAEAKANEGNLPDIPVTLYSVPTCDACDLVRNLLEKYGVPYEEKDASNDVDVQSDLKELAGQLSVPVLTVGDAVISGYTSSGITSELANAGFTPNRESGSPGAGTQPGAGLSEEEVARQAAEAAEALTADLEELPDDASFVDEVVEEIPEEEQIKVQVGQ